mmetsp:Transcript_44649/g.96756  ORF Transcript_44649/g.96756 Transcript_44649/m.96756 type:complete len:133 (+) Transcript_44649:139-537(+)
MTVAPAIAAANPYALDPAAIRAQQAAHHKKELEKQQEEQRRQYEEQQRMAKQAKEHEKTIPRCPGCRQKFSGRSQYCSKCTAARDAMRGPAAQAPAVSDLPDWMGGGCQASPQQDRKKQSKASKIKAKFFHK